MIKFKTYSMLAAVRQVLGRPLPMFRFVIPL